MLNWPDFTLPYWEKHRCCFSFYSIVLVSPDSMSFFYFSWTEWTIYSLCISNSLLLLYKNTFFCCEFFISRLPLWEKKTKNGFTTPSKSFFLTFSVCLRDNTGGHTVCFRRLPFVICGVCVVRSAENLGGRANTFSISWSGATTSPITETMSVWPWEDPERTSSVLRESEREKGREEWYKVAVMKRCFIIGQILYQTGFWSKATLYKCAWCGPGLETLFTRALD